MKKYIIYLPILLLPLLNLLLCEWKVSIKEIFIMAGIAFSEEVFFRGFLLSKLTRNFQYCILRGILVSSLVFSGMHLVNLFSGASLDYVLMQCITAGSVGFCFAIIVYRERSIILCVLFHLLINLTGTEVKTDLTKYQGLFYCAAAIFYVGYGIWMYQKKKLNRQGEKEDETLY